MARMADRMKASARYSADLEIIGLLRQLVAQQERTNALLQYLANVKHAETQQAPVPRDR